uniref:Uncharacterized protein n=2 Tax=Timema TaxID=61471 RepID=A0A7R9B7K1_TIMSH|nr:unnamed protein product [Timema shepardi]
MKEYGVQTTNLRLWSLCLGLYIFNACQDALRPKSITAPVKTLEVWPVAYTGLSSGVGEGGSRGASPNYDRGRSSSAPPKGYTTNANPLLCSLHPHPKHSNKNNLSISCDLAELLMMAKKPRHTIPSTLSEGLYLYGSGCEPDPLSFHENVLDYFELTTQKYMSGETWATIKETLESEAISTVTIRPLIKKYYDLVREIKGRSEHITQDETAAFLFNMYFKESGSFPRRRIVQFVLGEVPPSTIHNVFQIQRPRVQSPAIPEFSREAVDMEQTTWFNKAS